MSKHTPEPWEVAQMSDGDAICEVVRGEVFVVRTDGELVEDRHIEGDAELIAMAPTLKKQRDELLEACEDALTQTLLPIDGCDCGSCEAARAMGTAVTNAYE